MTCFTPLNGWRKPDGPWQKKHHAGADMARVPCGQCLGCRTDRRLMWSCRIMHEAHQHEHNSFITLTLRGKDKATPEQIENGNYLQPMESLDVERFKRFMKRLRYHFRPKKIRYYHAGEYGKEKDRPHYHAILFGLDFSDKKLIKQKQGVHLFTSKTLENIWRNGFVSVGEVTPQSAAYVAGYCIKKVTGKMAHEHYFREDEYGNQFFLTPEYATMSRGIGRSFYEKFTRDFIPSDETPVPRGFGANNQRAAIRKGVPRYYLELLKECDPETYSEIKDRRQKYALDNAHKYTRERLEAAFKVAKGRQSLQRKTL